MVKPVLMAAVVLAAQAGDSSCAPTPKACGLDFAGLEVQDGRVVDTVTVVCDRRPARHYLEVWIEYKPFDQWDRYGRTATTKDIPSSGRDPDSVADRPVRLTVSSECVRGAYRTRVHADGISPPTEAGPGIPFDVEDTGWQKYITAEDCTGGG